MTAQPDMLDYVIDQNDRRSIVRGGKVIAEVRKNACDAPLLRTLGAAGPWGKYAPGSQTLNEGGK